MIAVVPTGGANLSSLANALDRTEASWQFTEDTRIIESANKVILPGVGRAAFAMQRLEKARLARTLQNLEQPVLGICIGMQLLFAFSEEDNCPCLAIIPGKIARIPHQPRYPVPHMGWNKVELCQQSRLLSKELTGHFYYFVHSYYASQGPWVTAESSYGVPIPAVVEFRNFFGVQFHPEKSGEAGHQLLKRYTEI